MIDYKHMDSASRMSAIDLYGPEISALMMVVGVDSVNDEKLMQWSSSPTVELYTPAIDSIFPTKDCVKHYIEYTIGAAQLYGLNYRDRRYATVAYANTHAILFVDSVMLIALNHFIGADFIAYSNMPNYLRKHKTPENLKYAIAEAITAINYPYLAEGPNATLLSRMLYEGALVKVIMSVVENPKLNQAFGYSPEEMSFIKKNESELWRQLVAAKLLYETSESTIDRFVNPSPAVRGLDTIWPGRVGRFIGYNIVESYCKAHPETSLAYLLSPQFYNSSSTLADSHYNK
ncbi:MAG: hypothetical protein J1F05_01445 [Muribaculaceae bacterium]|nr:hypothetical protein [Muribaculaceae bacterium]